MSDCPLSRAIAPLGLLTLLSCHCPLDRDAMTFTRDSAGIVLVENRESRSSAPDSWRVDPAPLLSIGSEEGGAEYQFDGISGVARLADGSLIVADQTPSLRLFDRGGRFRAVAGRPGSGPGEYRGISLVRRFAAESLLVWDPVLRRATILAPDGHVARALPGPSLPGFYFPYDLLSDGAMLGLYTPGLDLRAAKPGPFRAVVYVLRFDIRSGTTDTVASLPGGTSFIGPGPSVMSVPFSSNPQVAGDGNTVYVGNGDTFEIRRYSPSGRLLRIHRLARPNPALTQGMIDEFIERMARAARTGDARLNANNAYHALPYPTTLPAYDGFLVDGAGNLWISDYAIAKDAARHWTVFEPAGRLLAQATTPPGFEVFQIGRDDLVGVAHDSLGIEQVQVLRLIN